MERRYTVIIEPDEDGIFIATCPALPGVVEQGDTQEEAFERLKEAATFTLDTMAELGEEIPPSDVDTRRITEMELAV